MLSLSSLLLAAIAKGFGAKADDQSRVESDV
jgi:hypothetical protein